MENIVLFKTLEDLSVRIHDQMNHWIVDKHQYKIESCFTWHFLFFELMTLIILMWRFLYY